ncbi:MAG: hypothetical protein REI64_09590 [Pedobacter sp.]|uniref:hypothetical protein n=1 Tax=Pedobacter sp. TaxID=1411316 RepID=UPI002808CDE7|nr:hypothetical protein [Pedobacter sp.]MDQ8005038.1 hypothetical protein [Pedobacter sp.]
MRKILLSTVIYAGLLFSACSTTKSPELQKLEARKEVLELSTKRNQLRIDLEKEKANNAQLKKNVQSLNAQANKKTDKFSASNPNSTAKQASETAKLLRDVEKANRKLEASERKSNKIQKDIDKVQEKINKLSKQIEFVDKTKS